jgi:hypothetical protein
MNKQKRLFDCKIIIVLKGDKKEIRRFQEQAKDIPVDEDDRDSKDLSFEKFLPVPQELERGEPKCEQDRADRIRKYGCATWYDWTFKNWGVERSPDEAFFFEEKNEYVLLYVVEQSPPLRAFIAISFQYPSIIFSMDYYYFLSEQDDEQAEFARYEFANGVMEKKEEKVVFEF